MKRWLLLSLLSVTASLTAHAAEKAPQPLVLPPGFAASDFELTPLPKPATQTQIIKLRHADAAFLASLLDPKTYPPAPQTDDLCAFAWPKPGQAVASPYTQPVFAIPEGIESWKPLPEQNAIQAQGTPEALAVFRSVIEHLDVPRQRVEIEADLYSVSAENLPQIAGLFRVNGQDLNAALLSRGDGQHQSFGSLLAFFGSGQKTLLAEAVKAGHLKFLNTQRNTVFNNWAACVGSQVASAVQASQINMSVTPIINGDGTITLLMHFRSLHTTPGDNKTTTSMTDTAAIVRDGDTVAFLTSPNATQPGWIYVLTPRILHQTSAATTDK